MKKYKAGAKSGPESDSESRVKHTMLILKYPKGK